MHAPDGYWLRPRLRRDLGAEGLMFGYYGVDAWREPKPSYRYHWLVAASFAYRHDRRGDEKRELTPEEHDRARRMHDEAAIFRDILEEHGCFAKTQSLETPDICDLYTGEAIHALYGLCDYHRLPGQQPQTIPPEGFPGAVFSRCSWGWGEYGTLAGERADTSVIAVSVSRAIKRLGERGLVSVYRACLDLTEEGERLAAPLSANGVGVLNSVSRYEEGPTLRLLGLGDDEIEARMAHRQAEAERGHAEWVEFMNRRGGRHDDTGPPDAQDAPDVGVTA